MRAVLIASMAFVMVGCQGVKPEVAKDDKDKDSFDAIAAITLPVMSASTDVKYYQTKYEQAWRERTPLVNKVLKEFPDDPRTAKVADEFWQSLMRVELTKEECDKIIAEISAARSSSTNSDLRQHAAFWSTFYSCYRDRDDIAKVLEFAEGFSNEYPKDPRGSTIFSFASMSGKATLEQMRASFQALIAKYPDTDDGGFARAMLPLLENVGKRFEFDFKDVSTGKRFTDESFNGKILVVDWWATWCVPCVQSMPKMKDLAAQGQGRRVHRREPRQV
jgi:thiol-disulfide isomerase/thioredoxin